jgi:hypothetical protein
MIFINQGINCPNRPSQRPCQSSTLEHRDPQAGTETARGAYSHKFPKQPRQNLRLFAGIGALIRGFF